MNTRREYRLSEVMVGYLRDLWRNDRDHYSVRILGRTVNPMLRRGLVWRSTETYRGPGEMCYLTLLGREVCLALFGPQEGER